MEDPYHADLTIYEVTTFLSKLSFHHIYKKSSHHIYIHPDYDGLLVIPTKHGRYVKGAYIKKIREILLEIKDMNKEEIKSE